MSALDLVEEFRSLDEIKGGANVDNFSAGGHNSIGGADLSGILTVDDDDDDDDDNFEDYAGGNGVKDSATTTNAAISPSRASASLLDGGIDSNTAGRRLVGGDQRRESEREAVESEAWDSDDDGTAVAGVAGFGKHQKSSVPAAENLDSKKYGNADDSSSAGSSNPNVSSPTRPAEEGSDWDGGAGPSSDDVESESDRRQPSSSSCELRWSKAANQGLDRGYAAGTSSVEKPSAKLSPPPPLSAVGETSLVSELGEERSSATSASGDKAETARVGRVTLPIKHEHHRQSSQSRRLSEEYCGAAEQQLTKGTEGDTTRQRASQDDEESRSRGHSDGEAETQEMFPATMVEAGAGAAATIEALRAELSTLREHVIRSERKREAQMRELGTRLEAQERRSGRSPAGCSGPPTRALPGEEGVESVQAALGVDEAVETSRRCPDTGGGSGTPQGVAVHNPFAGTGGGAATTPRDHFPAFEDALLDGGDEDEVAVRGNGGEEQGEEQEEEGEEEEKDDISVSQNEAFDFSIDTLSHINNHTDFGTDAPVTATAPPAATAATSPKIGRDGKTAREQREKGRLPWVFVEPPAPDAGGRLKGGEEGGAEEIFDAKDTAAEEAFFSDACATASLQTPVKHMLATAVSDLGVAVRRGIPRANVSTPARRRPAVPSFDGEQQEHHHNAVGGYSVGRLPNGRCESVLSCGDRASSISDPQSPELCMADVFARASAELEGGVIDGGEGGGGSLPAKRSSAVAVGSRSGKVFPPAEEEPKPSVGVDSACQTTWSFAAHDEVRFVSVLAIAPLSTRMADGRSCRKRTDDSLESRSSPGCRSEGNLEEDSASGAALGPATCTPSDGRGSCYTPRQSRLPLCKTPSRCPQRRCGELPAERASGISEASSFFNSPNVSPIAVARTRPDGSAAAGGALSAGAAQNGGASSSNGGWREGEENREGGGGVPRVMSARRQQGCQGVGQGLSPILSEGGGSASSTGVEDHQEFGRSGLVGNSRVSSNTGAVLTMSNDDGGDDGPKPTEVSGRGGPRFLFSGGAPVSRATRVDRSSGSGPLFMESSADVTRSSVLRASTTLDTMAPLDDTGPSFSYSSRTGVSFAGELFADSRLRASTGAERAPRYDVFVPPTEEQLRRGGGGDSVLPPRFLQQQFPQQGRQSRSAPTLASEWSTHSSRFEAERLAAGITREATSLGPGGVPPAVVGALLAAAIEGVYSHNACSGGGGGGGLIDQRVGAKRSQGSSGTGDLFAPDPTAGQTRPAQAHQISAPVYAAGPGDSPPPPPPPPETMLNGEHEEGVNEEEIFYQRQRLLQRVVSAAASHGGVMPSLSSVRDACAEEGQDGQEGEQEVGTSASKRDDESWRRHSDPLSWKTPSVAAAAATRTSGQGGATEASAGAAAGGWPVSSTPAAAYMRRHTSSYWRDRLGMTTH